MNLAQLIDSLRRNLKTVVGVSYGLLALVVAADFLRVLTEHEPEAAGSEAVAEPATGFWASLNHIAENLPAFWTLFGFLGCVLLVIVSKTYGHAFVSKREDYYHE